MTWHAYYDNYESLPQFNKDGSENLFSSINQERLINFIVESGNNTVTVNLLYGTIDINDNVMTFGLKSKPRLVYFRRNYVHTTLGVDGQKKEVYEYVGWQTTTESGENKKFIIGLYPSHIEVEYK